MSLTCFFFFQAEDGIRDVAVTGVQTCALPISRPRNVMRYKNPHQRLQTPATSGRLEKEPIPESLQDLCKDSGELPEDKTPVIPSSDYTSSGKCPAGGFRRIVQHCLDTTGQPFRVTHGVSPTSPAIHNGLFETSHGRGNHRSRTREGFERRKT